MSQLEADSGPKVAQAQASPARIIITGAVSALWAYVLASRLVHGDHPVFAALGICALACWFAQACFTRPGTRSFMALGLAMIAVGGFSGPGTDVLGAIPAFAGLLRQARDSTMSLQRIFLTHGMGIIAVGAGAVVSEADLPTSIGCFVGFLVIIPFGLLRRQADAVAVAERAALQDRLAAAHERARTAAAEERTAIARDLHDVLAHSLGGLTIQLDALAAEIEAGKNTAALSRARDARELAGSGLKDARRAAAALRAPAPDFGTGAEELIRIHRELGFAAEAEIAATDSMSQAFAEVLLSGLREFLTNARRHAPDECAHIEFVPLSDGYRLCVRTPASAGGPTSSTGGGFGLLGIRERAESIGGVLRVEKNTVFLVTLEVPQ